MKPESVKKAVNWHRGLFRGWVLFCFVWASAVAMDGAIEWHKWTTDHAAASALALSATPGSEIPVEYDPFNPPLPIWEYATIALIPPVLILALGCGVLWVARGFNRRARLKLCSYAFRRAEKGEILGRLFARV